MQRGVARYLNFTETIFTDNISDAEGIYLSQVRIQNCWFAARRCALGIELIVVIVLVLLLFGSFPVFPYSRDWGYRGSGVLGTILLIVIILWLLGKI